MSDPFSWSINLGRWAGVPVRLHFLLIVFVSVLPIISEVVKRILRARKGVVEEEPLAPSKDPAATPPGE